MVWTKENEEKSRGNLNEVWIFAIGVSVLIAANVPH